MRANASRLNDELVCYGLMSLKTAILVTSIHWLETGSVPSALVGMCCLALTLFLPALPAFRSVWFDAWLTASLACHVVFGMHFDLYEALPFYDKAVHVAVTAGFVMLGVTLLGQYCARHSISLSGPAYCGFALMFALSAGAAWEIFEFLIDRTELFQAQRGLKDTMLDLIADMVGGGLAVVLIPVLNSAGITREANRNSPARHRASI